MVTQTLGQKGSRTPTDNVVVLEPYISITQCIAALQ